jgi:hypothetical protein
MTVNHRSLSVAVEASYGSLNGVLPSFAGLSFYSLPCERDPVVIAGDVVANERTETRDGPHSLAPEPDTLWESGVRVQRRTGTIAVTIDFTTIGTAAANYDAVGLGMLLNGGFKTVKTGASFVSSVTGDLTDENTLDLDSATASDFPIGALIGRLVSGIAEYSSVTSVNKGGAGDIGLSPAFSSDGVDQTVYPMQTWYVPNGTSSGQTHKSLAFRIDGLNFRTYAFGCKLQSLNISVNGGRVMGEFTFLSAYIYDDHGNASGPVEPAYLIGASQHFRGARVTLGSEVTYHKSSPVGTDGEAATAIQVPQVENFTLNITNNLVPVGHSTSILTMSDMEVSDVTVECTLTLSQPLSDVASDFQNRTLRPLMIGTGPIGEGRGMAMYMPAAYLSVDPKKYDVGTDIVRQTLTYKASRFAGDVGANPASNAGNSMLRLALGV